MKVVRTMNKPKMILFDYGGTLMYEPDFCPANGNKAIYPYICENPYDISLDVFSDYLLALFDDIRALRGELIEIHEHTFLQNVLEYFHMELSVSIEEAEWIIWNGISKAVPTPGAAEMLKSLDDMGIRTGIISNLCWSEQALRRRLRQGFPDHRFDFIMTSSEYIFRKPDRHIFDMAVQKSWRSPSDLWYCGNDIAVDIVGAHNAGILPVFYDDRSVPSKIHEKNDTQKLDVPCLHIDKWESLIDVLNEI